MIVGPKIAWILFILVCNEIQIGKGFPFFVVVIFQWNNTKLCFSILNNEQKYVKARVFVWNVTNLYQKVYDVCNDQSRRFHLPPVTCYYKQVYRQIWFNIRGKVRKLMVLKSVAIFQL